MHVHEMHENQWQTQLLGHQSYLRGWDAKGWIFFCEMCTCPLCIPSLSLYRLNMQCLCALRVRTEEKHVVCLQATLHDLQKEQEGSEGQPGGGEAVR